MSVMWFVLAVAVLLAVLTVAGVTGRIDGSLSEPTSSLAYLPLPEDRLTPADLDGLRLDTGLRGYRMSEVDEVVDRLRREIQRLNEELAAARDGRAAPVGPSDVEG